MIAVMHMDTVCSVGGDMMIQLRELCSQWLQTIFFYLCAWWGLLSLFSFLSLSSVSVVLVKTFADVSHNITWCQDSLHLLLQQALLHFLPAQTFAETRHTHILFMAGFTADVYGQLQCRKDGRGSDNISIPKIKFT